MSQKKKKLKNITKTFIESCSGLHRNELSDLIIEAENAIRGIKEQQKEDLALREAKDVVKDLNSGYNSAIKMEREKIEFLLEKLNI